MKKVCNVFLLFFDKYYKNDNFDQFCIKLVKRNHQLCNKFASFGF